MKRTPLPFTLLGAVLVAGACAAGAPKAPPQPPPPPAATAPQPPSAPAPAAPPPLAPRPPAAPPLGDGIRWFRSSVEYKAIAIETFRAASAAVREGAKGRPPGSWAVVLDADESVLDNSVFQRDLARGAAPFSEELWAAFARTRSSVPVPGAKSFLELVKELGGRIAIVTNRWSNICEDTKENFRLQSLPFDVMLCRVNTGDKNPRFAAVADGSAFGDGRAREVVAFVGDNIQDFPALTQALRDQPESAFAAFGRRFFVMPNPMYGSWQQVPAR